MGRATGTQEPSVTLEVEVKFGGVGNFPVNNGTSRAVAASVTISFRLREESEEKYH